MSKKKYLSKLLDINKGTNFVNFYCDFETVVYKDRHYVTCYSIVGNNCEFSNIVKINTAEDIIAKSYSLVLEFVQKCFELSKTNKKKSLFFFHNLNKFDSYFLLNTLSNEDCFNIDIISRNTQIYKIIVNDKSNPLRIEFRDSLLYLPISLAKISEIFCSKHKKLAFDQQNNILENYLYDEKFKKSLVSYCLQDSLALKEGFESFLNYIRTSLLIEPLSSLSLPGISLRYFRLKFYDDKKFPIEKLCANKDSFVRKSYRGGTADVFKPYLLNGFHYDVNSLYPYIMKYSPMPIGEGKWVDIHNIDDFFGFVKVEVTSPEFIHKPFLNYYDSKRGLIAPIGSWVEIYFSEEIKYALTLGYKFKYLKGLSYEKGVIFDQFVESLYPLRLKHDKGSPLNTIIKLLLNSLYGRFGMKTDMLKSKIIENSSIKSYVSIYDVANISTFNTKSLINYKETPTQKKVHALLNENCIDAKQYQDLSKQLNSFNESSAPHVASAITAFARIFMDKFKRDPNLDVYYSDTDSIFCKNPLPSNLISDTELGKFKLENTIKEGIFLLPKVYMLKTVNNETIIKCKGLDNRLLTDLDIYDIYFNSTNFIKKFVSYFRRDFRNFIISKQQYNISISSKLLKRNKIIENGKWVDTKPLNIKE